MSDVYVRYSRKPVLRTLVDEERGITVDLDFEGEPVGVELLGAMSVEIDGQPVTHGVG